MCNIGAAGAFYEELRVIEDVCNAHDICRIELLVIWHIQSFEAKIAVILKIKLDISFVVRKEDKIREVRIDLSVSTRNRPVYTG